jgi:hypothetical protein
MMRTRRRKSDSQERDELARELEAMRLQVGEMQQQINDLLYVSSQFSPRALSGLRSLGVVLHFMFLPINKLKQLLSYWVRLARSLTDPYFYWAGLYWLSFTQILIEEIGFKEAVTCVWHLRRVAK